MNLWPWKQNPARQLSLIGHRNRREIIRARVDQMRAEITGQPPIQWRPLK